jgi:hypothetical protein
MLRSFLVLLSSWLVPFSLIAQPTPQSLDATKAAIVSAIVSDPSGARIPGATLHIVTIGSSQARAVKTDPLGRASIALPAGDYTVTITALGFDPLVKQLKISANTRPTLEARLIISTGQTVVQVYSDNNTLSTAADANKDAITLAGTQLAALSDDDSTFQQQLLAMAGGDGSHPPQVFVDGFSDGQFPPKSAIREVKINQNPFSAEYDSLGFGRIEISTKPGTGRIHGEIEVFGDPSALNSQNPFVHSVEPGYYRVHTVGNISGPIGKNISFFASADYYDQQNNAIINATTVAANSNAFESVNLAVPDPQTTASYTARLDRQWSKNNTFTGRYEYDRAVLTNGGLGQASGNYGPSSGVSCGGGSTSYTLPSQGFNCTASQHTVQLSNSEVVGMHTEIDTKFEWIHTILAQDPISKAPDVTVNGTVNDGGNSTQINHNRQDQFEFQANGTYERGKQLFRFGVRQRLNREADLSTAGFNGSFTFNSLADYQASVASDGSPSVAPSASQFSITEGKSSFNVLSADIGAWVEDEVKLSKSLTGDFGFRFESQTAIPDDSDPSPHFGLAWAPRAKEKKPAPVVYRIGSGIFYDRLPISDLLTTVRQGNPALETTYTITSARAASSTGSPVDFFARTSAELQTALSQHQSELVATNQTTYKVAPNYRSEYEIDSGASAEIALGKYGSISLNYLNFRGVHQLVSINANAPRADGTRPYGASAGDLYQYASGGETLANFAFVHPQINITKDIHFWAFAQISRFNGDSFGNDSFASNSYDIHQDYGRAPWDRHKAIFSGLDANLKHGLSASGFLAARGGRPFNIATGSDNNGDTIFNDRPSFASAADIATDPSHIVNTNFGNFHTMPTASEAPIPINYGHSAAFFSLQLQLSETIKFGPRIADPDAGPLPLAEPGKPAPKPDPRYALVFSVEGQNVTNTVSPDTRIGVLTSPYFGQSIASANSFLSTSAANRTLTLHTTLRF